MIYIVIPCYNCADTIERCVHSILRSASICKDLKYHIVLIDDVSTDNTYNILRQLDANFSTVDCYLKKSNTGPGAARNYGMHVIKSFYDITQIDYIWFIDADDYIEPDAFTKLYDLMYTNPDIICMSRYQNDDDITPFPDEYYRFDLDNLDIDKLNYIQRVKIIRAAWDKVYRFGICKDCKFAKPYRDEESLFTFMAFLNAEDIVTTSEKLYHYDFTDHGLSSNLNISDNQSTWWEIADRIRHDAEIRKTYKKLIPYAFEKNVYDIGLNLAEQMGINISKDGLKIDVNAMIQYAMWEDYDEEMVCSI